MDNVISTLKSRRNELTLEVGRINKAIAILSNGSSGVSGNGAGRTPRSHATIKPMSAAMKAKIGRGVRKAFLQRKREAAAKANTR
jgi:hypothetical protein